MTFTKSEAHLTLLTDNRESIMLFDGAIKGILQPKLKLLSSFTQTHAIPNLYAPYKVKHRRLSLCEEHKN